MATNLPSGLIYQNEFLRDFEEDQNNCILNQHFAIFNASLKLIKDRLDLNL